MSALSALLSLDGLVDLAVKSLAIMLASALLALLLRRASAAWRHLVWFMGVVGLLLLPILTAALPAWQVTWVPTWSEQHAVVATVDRPTHDPAVRHVPPPELEP